MIKKVALYVAAAAALATAAGVCVVSLAYAIFALANIWLTAAASAAIVTLLFAATIALVALVLGRKANPKHVEPEPGPLDRLTALAREKPLIAAGAAVVGAFLLIRNPGMAATMAMGLLAPKPTPPRRR